VAIASALTETRFAVLAIQSSSMMRHRKVFRFKLEGESLFNRGDWYCLFHHNIVRVAFLWQPEASYPENMAERITFLVDAQLLVVSYLVFHHAVVGHLSIKSTANKGHNNTRLTCNA